MTDNVTAIKPEAVIMSGGFVETESAIAILRAIRMARAKEKPTLIAGAPGVGKTATLLQAKREMPRAVFHTAVAGEGGVISLATGLCKALDLPKPTSRNLPETREEIADAIGVGGFIFLDEGQYLCRPNHRGSDNWDALEWMRTLGEEGMFGFAVCGDLRLIEALAKAPQFRRRTHPQVIIKYPSKVDVEGFCQSRGIQSPKEIDRLFRIAKQYGGLGDVSEILSTASSMCDGQIPAPDDVAAAIEYLGFKKGGA